MKLVLNTSPLIFLTKIDALTTLGGCFAEIVVPPAVLAEAGIEVPEFIKPRALSELGEAFVRGAIGGLHRGELEAMILARETGAGLVALDDLPARRKASQLGLRPIGTVGLILLAHRRGLIDAATAATKIETLVDTHGLYLSSAILDQVRNDLANFK